MVLGSSSVSSRQSPDRFSYFHLFVLWTFVQCGYWLHTRRHRPSPSFRRGHRRSYPEPADLQSSLALVRGLAYRSTATGILSGSPSSTLLSVRSRALGSRIGINVESTERLVRGRAGPEGVEAAGHSRASTTPRCCSSGAAPLRRPVAQPAVQPHTADLRPPR